MRSILRYISEQTGLAIAFVPVFCPEKMAEMAQSGELDLRANVLYDYTVGRNMQLTLSRAYLSTQYVLVLNKHVSEESLNGKRLALPKSSIYDGYFIGKVQYYDNFGACIRAVNDGKAGKQGTFKHFK